MSKRNDEFPVIASLVLLLSNQLTLTSERINKLEKFTNELVPSIEISINEERKKDATNDNDKLGEISNLDNGETSDSINDEKGEKIIIRELERERLDLVMDLQKRDYISNKLLELIDQNKDTVDSVKQYLIRREGSRASEYEFYQTRITHYTEDLIKPVIAKLDLNLFDIYRGIHKTQRNLNESLQNMESYDKVLQSEVYKQKLECLIKSLNKAYYEFSHIRAKLPFHSDNDSSLALATLPLEGSLPTME